MLYERQTVWGWVGLFRGGVELEVRHDAPERSAWWITSAGVSLGAARWGMA
jgi:hypothetical protein